LRELIAQLLEILDNAVVHERNFAGRMRMRVASGRRAVRSPAGMRDADIAGRVVGLEDIDEVGELPFGAATDKLAARHGANPGAIIAPILHPLQPIDQPVRNGGFANNSNNAAHAFMLSL
jgi:hypothetical protein